MRHQQPVGPDGLAISGPSPKGCLRDVVAVSRYARFTRFGRLLRLSSLDELPQLWNVLIGDESLVGPRAMVPLIADKLNAQQNLRHRVWPGITGWAQINGRNTLTWSKRVELDNWYIDNWSLWLDLRVLLRTIPVVVSSGGVRLDQSTVDVDDLG